MPRVVIENPILNSPFRLPTRHFKFSDDGITDEIIEGRRSSSYFIPIPRPRGGRDQLTFDTEWTEDRIEENKFINRVRQRVDNWRQGKYAGVTPVTARLLSYWTNPQREKRLFFCQIEALETAIYITEAAKKFGDTWIENELRAANDSSNPGLPRVAIKMATGTGKTVTMAMLVAWQALNKLANSQDARFSDAFLFVAPGITIRDRLRVLRPNDPDSYYRQRDILPPEWREELRRATILITNFHSFRLRETGDAARLTKAILAQGQHSAFTETPDQMVRRVCRELGNKKNIIVVNDEAHHCYRRKPEGEKETLNREDRDEVIQREEEARIWISGIEAIKRKIGVRAIYDLSATPFFLRGSGYSEGILFPWVVSDFSLIDAIESGIVKIPRVPVEDNADPTSPTYRDLWLRIREDLPRKGRRTQTLGGEPQLPMELQGALHSLYENYQKSYEQWEKTERTTGLTPPVFIVVCNNTNVSKMVFDYAAGWEKTLPDGSTIPVSGALQIFSNVDRDRWSSRPNSILVDSHELDSGEGLSAEFKRIAEREIEEFKSEYRLRTGHDPEELNDADILREVMNTVGKKGKLGENIRCVVSVSMLTEGWDANTVTHILGVRAFSTQLLCEQVVGRALRRTSYPTDVDVYEPEYAEVYGVPFSFIPCSGSGDPKPRPPSTHVRALEDRITCEITFPRVVGYRYELSGETLSFLFSDESKMVLSTEDVPTETKNAPIVGKGSIHTLDDLRTHRLSEVAFLLAKNVFEKYFRDQEGNVKPWLFPQLVTITKKWLEECVFCKDGAFKQMLLLIEPSHNAADHIYRAIAASTEGSQTLKPILRPYDTVGTTRYVDFDTIRPVYATRADKCHVSHVVADTESWEQKMAQTLEDMDEVIHYVKNYNVGFTIPYMLDGEEHPYYSDFVIHYDDGHGKDDLLNLIIEVTGERRREKAAKVDTAKTLWVPAINNHGRFGRWDFLEISDPWNAATAIRNAISRVVFSPLSRPTAKARV
jgi:type III restriction enzyme